MEKFWPRSWHHSGLYYRNTVIVLSVTLFVFSMAISGSFHWISIFILALGICFCYLLWSIYLSVHPWRLRILPGRGKPEFDLNCERVEFLSQDGLSLCGWVIPGARREIILLIRGLGTPKANLIDQARLLNNAGYSVMLLDLRAHGESEGDTVTGLWEAYDILSAIEYLESRPDVDAKKVGVWGIAFGAQVALQAAIKTKAIRALVLENLEPATLADCEMKPKTLLQQLDYINSYFQDKLLNFMRGVNGREGVLETLHLIYPRPVLFISTARGGERCDTRRFYDAARWPKACLEVPQTESKNRVINNQEYQERTLHFFDQAFS